MLLKSGGGGGGDVGWMCVCVWGGGGGKSDVFSGYDVIFVLRNCVQCVSS